MSNEAKALKQQGGKKFDLQKLLTAGALIILFLFFFIYGVFGRNVNGATFISNILESAYFVGFLALGVTFAIITGGIDLSVGSLMALSGSVMAVAATGLSMPPLLAVLFGIGFAVFGAATKEA